MKTFDVPLYDSIYDIQLIDVFHALENNGYIFNRITNGDNSRLTPTLDEIIYCGFPIQVEVTVSRTRYFYYMVDSDCLIISSVNFWKDLFHGQQEVITVTRELAGMQFYHKTDCFGEYLDGSIVMNDELFKAQLRKIGIFEKERTDNNEQSS